jgi:hypothetical protein
MLKFSSNINWKKVPYESEVGEFRRITTEILKKNSKFTNAYVSSYLKKEYNKKRPTSLSFSMWKNLSNTDSYQVANFTDIDEAIRKNEPSSGKRNMLVVLDEILGKTVRCPIILRYSSTDYTLIAGNTRLMAMKVIGIMPKVIVIDAPS